VGWCRPPGDNISGAAKL
jgi:hypothetical protein